MKFIKTLLFTVLFSVLISPAYAERNGHRDGGNHRSHEHDVGKYYKKRVLKHNYRSYPRHFKNKKRRYRHDNGLHRGHGYYSYPYRYYNSRIPYGLRRGYSPWYIDNNGWGLSLFFRDHW